MYVKCTELLRHEIPTDTTSFQLVLEKEDYSDVYPGMARYVLSVREGTEVRAVFRTNTYEYAPLSALGTEDIARSRAQSWEDRIRTDPGTFFARHPLPRPRVFPYTATDVVILQGSPRGEGNSSILAAWSAETVEAMGRTAQVLFPHDLDIHHCIGCYQCYNNGYCVFDDDMGMIIAAMDHADLVVVCTPVYTMTVPAGLKLLMDRCQAYHARRLLDGDTRTRKGVLLSVAGRKGTENFSCLQGTVHAFMRNLGMQPQADLLVDDMDILQDIRKRPDMREQVRQTVTRSLGE